MRKRTRITLQQKGAAQAVSMEHQGARRPQLSSALDRRGSGHTGSLSSTTPPTAHIAPPPYSKPRSTPHT